MKSYIALLCLGLALSSELPSSLKEYKVKEIKETQFASGKEYKYYYDAQILNGIPQASKRRSGQRIQAEVTVQVPKQDEFVVQLKHIKFGSLNQKVPAEDRVILPVDVFESLPLHHEQKSQLENPIKAVRRDGMITEIKYPSEEPAWAVNIKRSVLSMLSANLKAKNEIPPPKFCAGERCSTPQRSASAERQFFSAYEETVEGSCEATYTVVQNPAFNGRSEAVLNVTKAIDLANCRSVTPGKQNERPEIRYNWHLSDMCPASQPRSQFLNASTVIRMDMSGTQDSYLIERVESVSEYTVPDLSREGNVITSKVNSSLILIETSAIQEPLTAPSSSSEKHGKSLIYSLSWDALKEQFYMGVSDELSESPYLPNANKVQIAKKLLKQLALELSPSKPQKSVDINAPTTFLRLVRVMRMMKAEELNKLHEEAFTSSLSGLESEDALAVKDLIHSAMGAAGTEPCVEHIVSKIKEGELSQYQAAIAIRQLQNARVVSEKMIDEVKALCSSINVSEKPALKQAAMLALGAMARSFCVPRMNKFAVNQHASAKQPEACTESTRKAIVEYFVQSVNNNKEWNQQVLALKALANAALPESIEELAKIIKSSQHKEIVRTQAVVALRPLRSIVPEQVVRVTMPIFMDESMPTPVRIASAHITITASPQPSVLKSLVQQLNQDENTQVKSFVFTYLSNLANNTIRASPCNERVSAEAKIALQFIKEEAKISAGSFMSQSAMHSYTRKYGLDLEFASVMGNSSYLPQTLGFNVNSDFLGFFNRDLLSLSLASENIDAAVSHLLSKLSSEPTSRASRFIRSVSSATELRQKLSEMTQNYERMSPEASRLLAQARILGQEVGFMPLDKSIIEYIMEKFSVAQLEASAQPLNVNLASLVSEYVYKIPTTMGLPLVIRTQTPVIAQMKGSIGKRSDSEYLIRDVDMLPSITGKSELTMEIWSPMANSGLKVREEGQVQLPLRGSVKRVSRSENSNLPEYELEMKTPSSEGRDLVTIKTTPFTFTRVWEKEANEYAKPKLQIIAPEEASRVSKKSTHFDAMGVRTELRYHLTGLNFDRPSSSPLSPLSGPNTIHLTVRKSPESSTTKISLKGALSANELMQEQLESEVHGLNTQEYGSSEESSEESESFTSPQHYKSEISLSAMSHPGKQYRSVRIIRRTSPDSRLQKTEAKVFREASEASPEYCAETQLLFPEYPQKTADLNRKVNARHVFAWGPQCKVEQANNKVEILEQGERTKEKRQMEEKNIRDYEYCKDGRRSPIECYMFLEKASELNKYTMLINYPGMPVWAKNYTQKAVDLYIGAHRWQADVDKYASGPANQIKAVIRIDPYNPRRENITILEPGRKIVLKDIYVTPMKDHMIFNMASRSVVPMTVSPLSNIATCMVSDRQVLSFDQAAFQAPVTDCWSVIAKDCTPEARFAVLLKRMSMGSPAKKIRVLSKSQLIEISKDSDSFVMRVNGAEKAISESKNAPAGQEAYARKIGKSVVRIVLPEEHVTIYFDGETAAVRVPPALFNKQCGLCGHYNRNANDIFRGTQRQRHSSVVEFFKQYQIQEGSCQVAPTESQKYRKEPSFSGSSSDETESPRSNQKKPIELNRIAHEGGQICVSTKPVKTCPEGYYAKETVSVELEFGCVANHYDGLEIEALARESPVTDLPEFSNRFTRSARIATKCARY